MATLNTREKARERARKHAQRVWSCPICGQKCRGNGGRASHQRKHVTKAGYDDGDISAFGLRAIFRSLGEGERPKGLRPPPAWERDLEAEQWTSDPVDRSGPAKYVIMMRAVGDPERRDRAPSLGGQTDGLEKISALKGLRKAPVTTWKQRIVEHLADGIPRTFNRIGVELCDRTADNLIGSHAEKAIWEAVEAGLLEHTMAAPILFRKKEPSP